MASVYVREYVIGLNNFGGFYFSVAYLINAIGTVGGAPKGPPPNPL